MKRYIYLIFVGLATFIFASCEGPAGPAGVDGMDGADGEDMTSSTCLQCHGESQDLIRFQFNSSAHNVGAIAVDYAGSQARCAPCHSHELYVEWAETGSVAEDVTNPSAWQCKTCHSIHATFEPGDLAFRAGGAVTLSDGSTVDAGNNNTCINCHQARHEADDYVETAAYTKDVTYVDDGVDDEYTPWSDAANAGEIAWGPAGGIKYDNGSDTLIITFDVPTTHAYINSTHAGPHHGPQGSLWAGKTAGGDVTSSQFAAHDGGCVECHMGPESGHNFKPADGNCMVSGCHSAVPEASLNSMRGRLEAIGQELAARHIVHIDPDWEAGDPLFGSAEPLLASITKAEFYAWFNFMYMVEDRSNGAHNPTYFKAMLTQCEVALGL